MTSLKPSRQIMIWLFQAWKPCRTQSLLNVALGVMIVLIDLAFVWATKLCIDIATRTNTHWHLKSALAILITLLVTQLLLSYASRWVKAILGARATCKMQSHHYEHLLQADWVALKNYHTGDILNRLEKDVNTLVVFLTESVPAFLTTLLRLLGAFVLLYIMNRTLAWIIAIIFPLFLLISKLYVSRTRRLTQAIRASESQMQTAIQEGLQHITVIKVFQKAAHATQVLAQTQDTFKTHVRHKTRYSSLSSLTMNLGFAAGYIFTFGWGVVSLESGVITYGALIAFMQLVGQIQAPIRSLSRYIPLSINALTAGERLMELQKIAQEHIAPCPTLTGSVGIRLHDVCFSYDKSSPILQHFSYDFPPGSKTAIIGETGKGKTTLIRLMLSLLRPQAGILEIYNAQTHLPLTGLSRDNFSYVPQGNTLLNGTVKSNLLLGNEHATDAEMQKALHAACADFVLQSTDGLDMKCGEGGNSLSEGQAQRISIARALLKPCNILILDEATSSLDNKTESMVVNNLMQAFPGKTMVIVTHRPEILKYCTHTLHL